MTPRPDSTGRGWPAWVGAWAALQGATLAAVLVLGGVSVAAERAALESALADHLGAVAGAADGALHELPVEALVALGGDKSAAALRERVDDLAVHGGLRGLALVGPGPVVVGHGGRWVPLAAETDLVARAAAGERVTGPLYRDDAGELYQTAYAPLTGHTGWVVAVEGSAATLGAVDRLQRAELWAGGAVLLVAALASVALAAVVARPVRRLGHELAAVHPGSPPDAVGDYGFREVRGAAAAARKLLVAIRLRDDELRSAHQEQLDQLTRMAAGLAHEVGNPLNAVSLSVERLATLDDPARRAAVVDRVRGQVLALQGIVDRLRDLTQPLRPQRARVDLGAVVDDVAVGIPAEIHRAGNGTRHTDAVLVGQIVRNLLLNAAQAGATRIDVAIDEEGVLVRDDGPGIPDDQVDAVFAWFHTTRAKGSGLGLPMSRRLAEALGGELRLVTPKPATFRLHLPAEAP